MIKRGLIIFLVLTINHIAAESQNILWLTNGKQVKIGEFKIDNPDLITYKNLKGKDKAISSFDVFSIIENGGNERIIYIPDTSYQGAFTLSEMRSFVQGEYDASQKFKSPWTTVGGIVISAAAPQFINPVYVFLLSGGYCTTIGLTNTKEKRLNIPAEYAQNEHYKLGYKKAVKHKRIKNSIIGSAIGLAAGLSAFAIINKK